MQTKNYKDFCPYKQSRIITYFFWQFFGEFREFFFGYDPCLFGRAEILVIFGLHFGRNDDLINSFGISLTFTKEFALMFLMFHYFQVYEILIPYFLLEKAVKYF